MKTKHKIKIGNKQYSYFLNKNKDGTIRIVVKSANINQDFLEKDVPKLIMNLPNLILAEKDYIKKQDQVVRFRLSAIEKNKIEKKALESGFSSVSEYLRSVALS